MATRYTVAAAGMAATLLAATGYAAADDRPAIVVHVDNSTLVPARTLSRAKEEVERVFHEAGVSVTWADGPLSPKVSAGEAAGATRHLALLILDASAPAGPVPQEAGGQILGKAVHALGRGYVLSHRVARASVRWPVDADVVLGRVMAHELGHLLLPVGTGHTRVGIMQPQMSLSQVGLFSFTGAQAATIRELLTGVVARR